MYPPCPAIGRFFVPAIAGALLVTSCSPSPAEVRGVAGDPTARAQVASTVQAPHIVVEPGDKAESVRLDRTITVRVERGRLQSVRVHNAEEPERIVLGHMAPDELSWSSAEVLGNHTRYSVDVLAVGPRGETTSSSTTFTTMFVTRL
ncbi:MAG: Ig-like domain-containing protein, partial [Candidatus Dormibacteria bacterium]